MAQVQLQLVQRIKIHQQVKMIKKKKSKTAGRDANIRK